MPTLHDYSCDKCGKLVEDSFGYPDDCDCGSSAFTITFAYWRTISCLEGGMSADSLVDSKGNRKKFTFDDDPLCAIEAGLSESKGIRALSDDQTMYFMEKRMTDGNSIKLRDEVLKARQSALKSSEG